MQIFCEALADGGFDVYAIDLPGHGDSIARFTASAARSAVAESLHALGHVDVVIGHSLGAGLLLDVANERDFPRMVLVSPPPTPLDSIDLSRTLVVTGVWDIPAINQFVPRLEGAQWWRLPWAAHSSVVLNSRQTADVIRWLGGVPHMTRATSRLRWIVLMLVSSIALGAALLPTKKSQQTQAGITIAEALGRFVLCGFVSAVIVKFMPVMNWLHLFAADYMLGMFFITGVLLCVWAFRTRGKDDSDTHPGRHKAILICLLATTYTIAIIGYLAGGHLMHFALNDGRWWRFPAIAAASFPLFYFDELCMHALDWKSTVTGVLSRALIGIAVLAGILTLNRRDGFFVLIVHLIVLFWIGLWFMTGVVRRHTHDPLAAALFAALVQGWMFAAWFVTV